jgi:transcriptional regulator with XRE-family HTH domain
MPVIHPNASERRKRLLARQAKAMAAAREAKGLSQPAAAAALGVLVDTYRSWEYGKRQPPVETRRRLVAEWGVPARALALGEGDVCPHCGRKY